MYKVSILTIVFLTFTPLIFSEELNLKENVAVLDLLNRGGFNKNEIGMITDRVNTVISDLKIFNLIERNQIDLILKEQGFQQTGCTDQSCMVEAGQLLSVSKIISGNIGKLEHLYTITLKILDVETGKVISQISKDIEAEKTELLKEHIPILTKELLIKAGVLDEQSVKKRSIISKPGFFVPAIAIIGGGITAGILLSRDNESSSSDEPLDMSDFPNHTID